MTESVRPRSGGRATTIAPAPAGTAPFHERLDRENETLWAAIFELPFIREIAAGTLSEDRFRYFVEQDILYLDAFTRTLTRAAAWADTNASRQLLIAHVAGVLSLELGPHTERASQLRIEVDHLRRREPAPVTVAYVDHMLRVAEAGPLGEVIAAVLPCYWVYRRVGERLAPDPPRQPLYRDWVLFYASPEFADATAQQIALLERLAAEATEPARERMARWFRRSLRYEWMFWDQAYRQADWPVS